MLGQSLVSARAVLVLSLAVLFALGACTIQTKIAGKGKGIAAGLYRLSGDEIKLLLVGHTLSYDLNRKVEGNGVVVISPYQETYKSDGTVEVLIHHTGMGGRYITSDNRLCLFLVGQAAECRYLFRTFDGALLQKGTSGSQASLVPIVVE